MAFVEDEKKYGYARSSQQVDQGQGHANGGYQAVNGGGYVPNETRQKETVNRNVPIKARNAALFRVMF